MSSDQKLVQFFRISIKLADKQHMHKVSDEVEEGPDRIIHFRVTYLWPLKLIICFYQQLVYFHLIIIKLADKTQHMNEISDEFKFGQVMIIPFRTTYLWMPKSMFDL